jgi:predicted cupin superfamily sugar epimerase
VHERAAELIAALQLRPHPEGGYYRELYRSREHVTPGDGRGARASLTTIYFLLAARSHSRWHHVQSDEVWHLYEGGPLELLELDERATELSRHRLAAVGDGTGAPVHTVANRRWQAARLIGPYALVGCTVAPGFEFADFRLLADDAPLAAKVRDAWPNEAALI